MGLRFIFRVRYSHVTGHERGIGLWFKPWCLINFQTIKTYLVMLLVVSYRLFAPTTNN